MTGPQKSYLHTLAREAGREVDLDALSKADASKLIDEPARDLQRPGLQAAVDPSSVLVVMAAKNDERSCQSRRSCRSAGRRGRRGAVSPGGTGSSAARNDDRPVVSSAACLARRAA